MVTHLEVGDVDLVLRPGHQGGELLAAEHPQPVQAYHVRQPGPKINVVAIILLNQLYAGLCRRRIFIRLTINDSLLGHNNTDNNNTDCLNVIFSLSGITIKTIVLKNFLHR